jgi:hypothetical protein
METLSLKCTVAAGQFTGEYAVSATQSDGRNFSLFVDENLVDSDQGMEEGWLSVEVIDRKGDNALIRLPAPSLEGSQIVTVKSSQLRSGSLQGSRH